MLVVVVASQPAPLLTLLAVVWTKLSVRLQSANSCTWKLWRICCVFYAKLSALDIFAKIYVNYCTYVRQALTSAPRFLLCATKVCFVLNASLSALFTVVALLIALLARQCTEAFSMCAHSVFGWSAYSYVRLFVSCVRAQINRFIAS